MQSKYVYTLLLILASFSVHAQGLLKGSVYENGTNNKMADVFIRDKNTKQRPAISLFLSAPGMFRILCTLST